MPASTTPTATAAPAAEPDDAASPLADAPRIDRRSVLAAGALAVAASPFAGLLLSSTGRSTAQAAEPDPAVVGRWEPPFPMGGVAIHATLTHVGDVLFFGKIEGKVGVDHTSYSATWNHVTGKLALAPLPYDRDIFCAGHNVLPDGRVYVNGGHDHNLGSGKPVGVVECDVYDPATRTWTRTAPLTQARWYPTTVGLGDGRVLSFGGHKDVGQPSDTVEEWNPATGVMRTLPASATKGVGLYPRLHLVADGSIVKTGPARATLRYNPTTMTWSNLAPMVYGNRTRGLSILLPGANKVLALGGAGAYTGPPTNTAEVLDLSVAKPTWRAVGSMTHGRIYANGQVLPDGSVFVVGGGQAPSYTGPVLTPEIWNPVTETFTAVAPHLAGRMYHATMLLLPDGRVFVAGQDFGNWKNYGEIYSPPYLFRGARPTISTSPPTAAHGSTFTVTTPESASIKTVVLIRAGSVTHQINTDQRSVPLAFTTGVGSLTVTAPATTNLAPRGYYMLFVVDGNGVPSVAKWLKLV